MFFFLLIKPIYRWLWIFCFPMNKIKSNETNIFLQYFIRNWSENILINNFDLKLYPNYYRVRCTWTMFNWKVVFFYQFLYSWQLATIFNISRRLIMVKAHREMKKGSLEKISVIYPRKLGFSDLFGLVRKMLTKKWQKLT